MQNFSFLTDIAQITFHLIGLCVLFFGGVSAIVYYLSYKPWFVDQHSMKKIEVVRIAFAQKIVFGLEFFIIADAIATIMRPTIDELVRLALIVTIRTILSFFLSRELYTHHHV